MVELWKPVPGWPEYEVSKHGRVRRRTPGRGTVIGRILRPRFTRKGYVRVALHNATGRREVFIHTLVLEAFTGPRPAGYQCNHIDGTKTNNHLANLEWVTAQANMEHARVNGLLPAPMKGEANPRAKLTAAQVALIRGAKGRIGIVRLAEIFGVSDSLISQILLGRIWKGIPPRDWYEIEATLRRVTA